jgi:hypothetical protein
MKQKLYKRIASLLSARKTCLESKNVEWTHNHENALVEIERNYLPSGAGFDAGTQIDLDLSTPEKIALTFEYHHMNENGFYTNWTKHLVVIEPSLVFDIELKISKNRVDECILDYFYQVFEETLNQEIEV